MRNLVTLPGNKAAIAALQANYLPGQKINKSWETNAGTCAFSNNILSGIELDKMYATEIEVGMYSLLKSCKEEPYDLVQALRKTEYSMEEFDKAQDEEATGYIGMSTIDIAVAKYVLLRQSINGIGKDYRDIDKGRDIDIKCMCDAQLQRERYKRRIMKIIEYSECMQNVELIHGDMLDYFDNFASDPKMFIYSDIPYTTNLRASNLYKIDTDYNWHEKYAKKLADMTHSGKLKAKVMLCNYVNENMKNDIYCKELLKEGWTLYLIKDVNRPTVIKKDSKVRKKNKAVEAIFLNYKPINPTVGKERIFTYEDVYGKGVE